MCISEFVDAKFGYRVNFVTISKEVHIAVPMALVNLLSNIKKITNVFVYVIPLFFLVLSIVVT